MILLLLLFLLLAPYLVGRPVGKLLDPAGHNIVDTYLYGVMTLFITSGGVQLLLILRKGPFSDYEKWYPLILLLFALAGMVLTVLESSEGGFLHVRWAGYEGYVSGEYVTPFGAQGGE